MIRTELTRVTIEAEVLFIDLRLKPGPLLFYNNPTQKNKTTTSYKNALKNKPQGNKCTFKAEQTLDFVFLLSSLNFCQNIYVLIFKKILKTQDVKLS